MQIIEQLQDFVLEIVYTEPIVEFLDEKEVGSVKLFTKIPFLTGGMELFKQENIKQGIVSKSGKNTSLRVSLNPPCPVWVGGGVLSGAN